MIKIKPFIFNPFQENTFVLYDETKEAIIIDAGCYTVKEEETLDRFIKENDLKPVHLLTTHCHIDHILGNRFVTEFYQIIPEAHKDDEFLVESVQGYGATFGIQIDPVPPIGKYLEEGMKVHFGNSFLDILHIPGHSPGGIVFYNKEEGFIIAGDVLFEGSIGRSDLPGGNHNQLISNIKGKLLTLDEKMIVYAGHGPSTTIGAEKKSNPFLI
jgi:glyoxylase-like metal-dependent hydrolase (beta-lactamase superfamily II)